MNADRTHFCESKREQERKIKRKREGNEKGRRERLTMSGIK